MAIAASACGRVAFDARSDGTTVDTTAPDVAASDLVAHFPLEGGETMIVDQVSGLIGTCRGTCPAVALTPSPNGGSATAFDGVDHCYVVADDPMLRPATFTIAVWARHDAVRNDSMIGKVLGPLALEGNSFQLETGDGGVWPADAAVFSTGSGTNEFLVQLGLLPAAGVWHHYAGTFDGSQKQLYVDGMLVGTSAGTVGYDSGELTIGCDKNLLDQQYWDGDLDDVRIYRRALTGAEITDLASP